MSEYLFNKTFAESRGISEQHMDAMNVVYKKLHNILKRPSMHCETPQEVVDIVQGFEYTLQSLWGFPFSKDFHSYWFEIKGCTCPKVDNRERFGTKFKIITLDCPFHGDSPADTWDDKRFS